MRAALFLGLPERVDFVCEVRGHFENIAIFKWAVLSALLSNRRNSTTRYHRNVLNTGNRGELSIARF